ncbi:hypothetical protein HCG69_12360 [Bacteroides sp. K03]|jgi:serine protease Do|uniref:trypsin-like peptidase domain-containing protein n=1 Tax=Bacteroides sp. K03 TaxID=2718928 RepID=UPI001C8B781C|nr:trypsin-like peptidase domain-containing protein [Bacteroides sp. K03]MBX9188853.1 hypothetical protein [Bacteroides sp. K03]
MNKNIFLILGVILAFFSSCQKNLKDIIHDTESATFIIYTYDEYGAPLGSGSGFFIDSDGTGITNYHVLDGAVKAMLKTSNGKEYEIDKVLASDKKWDIIKFSIIALSNQKFPYLEFATKGIEQGDKVYNISSPLGLEKSVSDGIVASLRNDKQHGDIIQVTAPISPGSSGSALLNEKGEVFAVATFNRTGGQNLNFGVSINKERLTALTSNDFNRFNPKFNNKENFIILNIPNERNSEVVLNAIEFKDDVTIAYLSYTNLNLSMGEMYIWCEIDKGDDGFLIHDLDNNSKYYVTSSTIGVDKMNGTKVSLASNYKFKVFFPPIKSTLHKISITYGNTSRGWQFRNIDLDKYKSNFTVDMDSYQKEYAYSTMHEGNFNEAIDIFTSILNEKAEDIQSLNALGIISYVVDNNRDAESYFSQAVEYHPNNPIGYINRCHLYRSQKRNEEALQDITKAINLNNAQPDNYTQRAFIYMDMNMWDKAESDWTKALSTDDFKRDAMAYYNRAICRIYLNEKKVACEDIQIAYNLTSDTELEQELNDLWNKCGCY